MISIKPTKPIETDEEGNYLYQIYGQDGQLITMKAKPTKDNEIFITLVRQMDRYNGVG